MDDSYIFSFIYYWYKVIIATVIQPKQIISHRGAAGLAVENSADSLLAADKFGPRFIETDIHRTSDGVFVMYHGVVKQGFSGNSLELTYSELKAKVPTLITLKQALELALKSPLLLDIKINEHMADLIEHLKVLKLDKKHGFTGPHIKSQKKLKKAFPDNYCLISVPYHHTPILAIETARDNGLDGISLNKWWLSPVIGMLCRYYKLEMMIYTVDQVWWARLVHLIYPRSLICTNYPNKLI
jgi:hypothetical protein